jgi:hypothetical protein
MKGDVRAEAAEKSHGSLVKLVESGPKCIFAAGIKDLQQLAHFVGICIAFNIDSDVDRGLDVRASARHKTGFELHLRPKGRRPAQEKQAESEPEDFFIYFFAHKALLVEISSYIKSHPKSCQALAETAFPFRC